MIIALWEFPAADFAAWAELVGMPEVSTHAEYITLLAAVQADQERQGLTVRRVTLTVAEMRSALAAAQLANTPDNRAFIVATKQPDT